MSIQNQIDGLADDISAAYDAVAEMGGTVPEEGGSVNLPTAIRSIPSTGGEGGAEAMSVVVSLTNAKDTTNVTIGYTSISGEWTYVTRTSEKWTIRTITDCVRGSIITISMSLYSIHVPPGQTAYLMNISSGSASWTALSSTSSRISSTNFALRSSNAIVRYNINCN